MPVRLRGHPNPKSGFSRQAGKPVKNAPQGQRSLGDAFLGTAPHFELPHITKGGQRMAAFRTFEKFRLDLFYHTLDVDGIPFFTIGVVYRIGVDVHVFVEGACMIFGMVAYFYFAVLPG